MQHFCTYFDYGYLPKAVIMLTSLKEHCSDAFVHVLCLDEPCHKAMQAMNLPDVQLYQLADLEAADPQLEACKAQRTTVEYYWTITPCFPSFIFLQQPAMERLTYLDADLYFMSDPGCIFAEAPDASVFMTPHRFPPQAQDREECGIYNVSWLTFVNTQAGRACLSWYRERCIEWCYYRLEDGRFGDQKYLESFPKMFPGVHGIEHVGAGLAPWNAIQYQFACSGDNVTVDGKPIVFYHAHAFWNVCCNIYDPGIAPYMGNGAGVFRERVLKPYAQLLHRAGKQYGGDTKGILRRGGGVSIPPLMNTVRRLLSREYIWV